MAGPWIKFAEVDLKDGRKTKVWAVMTLDRTNCLGRVGWFSPWRRYCYFPHPNTVYEEDCLELIAQWCKAKTKEHKEWQRRRLDPTATISPKAPSGDTANRS
jgi:hypothetical protein